VHKNGYLAIKVGYTSPHGYLQYAKHSYSPTQKHFSRRYAPKVIFTFALPVTSTFFQKPFLTSKFLCQLLFTCTYNVSPKFECCTMFRFYTGQTDRQISTGCKAQCSIGKGRIITRNGRAIFAMADLSYMTLKWCHTSMTLNDPNQDFNSTPLFDVEYMRNGKDTNRDTMEY